MTFKNVSKKLVLVAVSTLALGFATGCENNAEERAEQRAENMENQNTVAPTAPAAPATGARVCAEGENGTTADGQPCTLPTSRNPASVEAEPEE